MKYVLLALFILVIAGAIFYFYWHGSAPTQIQSTMQKIDSQIAPITGDRLDIYIPIKPINSISQQLTNNPLIQQEFKPYIGTTLLGNDSHGNLLIKNQSNIINSSSLNPNATQYLKDNPEIFANTQNISGIGYNYGSVHQGTASLTPQATDSVYAGDTYHMYGKLYLYDKTKCNVVTQNSQSTTQCQTIIPPYQYRIIVSVTDTDPYRISYMNDKVPTNRAITNGDGSFVFDWTTLSDKYYIGNYNAHFWVESESKINGQTITDEFDHPFTVLAKIIQ